MAESVEEIRTLTALLEHQQPTWDQVLDWSEDIAVELAAVHARGEAHGDVTTDGVWVEKDHARLSPPADLRPTTSAIQDIVQFSGLLRSLIGAAQASSPDERLKGALEQIAATSARAAAGSSIRKVSSVLRVIRSTRRFEEAAKKKPAVPQAREIGERRGAHRVLLLAREVPPAIEPRRRLRPSATHILAIAGAGALTIAVLIALLMKFGR